MDGWNGVVKRMTTGGRKGWEGFWWKAKGGSGEELDRGQNAAWIRSSRVLREEGGGDVDYREKGAEVFSLFSNIYIYIFGRLRMLPRQEFAFLGNAKRIFFELVGFPRNPNNAIYTGYLFRSFVKKSVEIHPF